MLTRRTRSQARITLPWREFGQERRRRLNALNARISGGDWEGGGETREDVETEWGKGETRAAA